MQRIFVSLIALLLLGLAPAVTTAAASGQQAYDRGITAFRAGDFTAALAAFLHAQWAGVRTSALRYNLGVTYYRLQRYADAQREFEALARDPAWAPLAYYNLGLTAQRLGQTRRAEGSFRRAHQTATEPKLRALAATALARLERMPAAVPATSALFAVAGGYDSNVTLTPDAEVVGIADNSDLFAEATGVVVHRLAGDTTRGFHVHGGVQVRDYFEINEFDQLGVRAGLSRDADSGRWQTGIGGIFDVAYVNGDRLLRVATLEAQARRRLTAGRDWRARYQYSDVDGDGGFGYLDGSQQRLLLDAGLRGYGGYLRLGYQLERNDRADLESGGDFYSYSPTRHSLLASYTRPARHGWQLHARGEYRYSRYDDPNRIGGTSATRAEDRYLAALRADYPLAGAWRWFLDYSYVRNESNFDAYDYRRHQVLVGVELAQ